jgi:hypothetical protein
MKKRLRKLAIWLGLGLIAGALSAQSGHVATISVKATAPGTATVLRADGLCPATGVPASGTTLTSTLALPTANTAVPLDDATVVDGNSYCYWSTFKSAGGGSAVSNTFLGSIGVTVSIAVAVH